AVAAVAPAPAALATGPAAPPQEQTQGQEQEQEQAQQHEQLQQPQDQDQTEHAEQQAPHENPWFAPQISQEAYAGSYDPTTDEWQRGGAAYDTTGLGLDYYTEFRQYIAAHQTIPTAGQFALYLHDFHGVVDPQTGDPVPEGRIRPYLEQLRRDFGDEFAEHDILDDLPEQPWWLQRQQPEPALASGEGFDSETPAEPEGSGHLAQQHEDLVRGTQSVPHQQSAAPQPQQDEPLRKAAPVPHQRSARSPQDNTNTEPSVAPAPAPASGGHTVVDRYYQAWMEFQTDVGCEPKAADLSEHLARHGVVSRSGKPVSPSTLRRYLLDFRIYSVWDSLHEDNEEPRTDQVVKELTERGITGQYSAPITESTVAAMTPDFQRRRAAFADHTPA
ncbi:hypothetical protein ACIPYN_38500, partial [Streptomyces sp. NPDC090053]